MNNSYKNELTANINNRGIVDVDTIKGCQYGLELNSNGCYGNCYACRNAKRFGRNFSKSIIRKVNYKSNILNKINKAITKSKLSFMRIGVMGDPSHAWEHTLRFCELVQPNQLELFFSPPRHIVIITKHWIVLTENQIDRFGRLKNVIFNTSISPLDTDEQIRYRLQQYHRIKNKSILRIVSCDFNDSKLNQTQQWLFDNEYVIDNPLRCFKKHNLVISGKINIRPFGNQFISQFNDETFTDKCKDCPDMCGVNS